VQVLFKKERTNKTIRTERKIREYSSKERENGAVMSIKKSVNLCSALMIAALL
jgi:hypothetical protein